MPQLLMGVRLKYEVKENNIGKDELISKVCMFKKNRNYFCLQIARPLASVTDCIILTLQSAGITILEGGVLVGTCNSALGTL